MEYWGIGLMTLAFFLLLISFSLTVSLIPCWIIAARRKVAEKWWYWITPGWNVYIAAKVGRVPRWAAIVLTVLFVGSLIALEVGFNNTAVMNGVFFAVAAIVLIGSGVLYFWFMNIGKLAQVHKHLLPVVMIVLPVVIAVMLEVLATYNVILEDTADLCNGVLSITTWLFFFWVAFQTPKVGDPDDAEFTLGKT